MAYNDSCDRICLLASGSRVRDEVSQQNTSLVVSLVALAQSQDHGWPKLGTFNHARTVMEGIYICYI